MNKQRKIAKRKPCLAKKRLVKVKKAKPCAAARKRKAAMRKPTRYSTKRCPRMRPGPVRRKPPQGRKQGQARKPTKRTATKRGARAPRCRLGIEDPGQASPLEHINEDQVPSFIEG